MCRGPDKGGSSSTGSSPSSPSSTSMALPHLAAPLANCSIWAVPGVSLGASSMDGSALTAAPFNVSDALAVVVHVRLLLPWRSGTIFWILAWMRGLFAFTLLAGSPGALLRLPISSLLCLPPSTALRDQFWILAWLRGLFAFTLLAGSPGAQDLVY
jgi:hypothetical protein